MKVILVLLFAASLCSADFYSYSVEDVYGKTVSLDKFRGKVGKAIISYA